MPDTAGWKVRLIFRKRPALMVSTSTSAKPDLKEDWHRIFVFGAISELASMGSNPDVAISNNFTLKYNELMNDILLAKYNDKPYPRTKIKDWRR